MELQNQHCPLEKSSVSVELQRKQFKEENLKRRKALQKKIYDESNFYDKIKINIRTFFVWLLYKDE